MGDSEGSGLGVGDGVTVGIGIGLLGRISKSLASSTTSSLVDLLYVPTAKIRLPISESRSIVDGTSSVITSEDEDT